MASEKARSWAGAVLIAAAAAGAYATSFAGSFQFDDIPAILDNPTIRWLWPPTIALYPPIGALTVSGRPILNLSLAVSHALSGYRPWGYHAVNLLIHIGAALVLAGVVRRTLVRTGAARPRASALAVALLWAVHPLTTEAVTYVVQRAESLMALCYLLVLYGFIRGVDEGAAGGRERRWFALAWLACFLGVGTKEVIVTAPVTVWLYDRTFIAKSWLGPWRARKGFYLALAATWLPLLGLVAWTGWDRGATSGFHVGVAWWPYWRSQGEALVRYLALALWPHPLIFDYGPSTAPVWLATGLFGIVAAGLAATIAGAWRGRPWAFPAAASFLILAPTSVMPGVLQFACEHRAYLPLAAVVTAVVLGVQAATRRVPAGTLAVLLGLAVVGLGAATARRNLLYRTDLGLWLDTVAKRPGDPLAQANVGHALLQRNRVAEAIPYCQESIRLDPTKPQAHYNLGLAYESQERWTEALGQFTLAATINPDLFYASFRAGRILDRLGRPTEAVFWLQRALAVEPNYADSHGSLGVALAALGRPQEAIAEYQRSLSLRAEQPEVEFNLGVALAGLGRIPEAERHYAAAVRLDPGYGQAELNLGVCLAQEDKLGEAVAALRTAIRLLPKSAVAHASLALGLDQQGHSAEAIPEYRRALELQPGYPEAHYNLGNALLRLGDPAGARDEFSAALRLRPDFGPAREMLDRLGP